MLFMTPIIFNVSKSLIRLSGRTLNTREKKMTKKRKQRIRRGRGLLVSITWVCDTGCAWANLYRALFKIYMSFRVLICWQTIYALNFSVQNWTFDPIVNGITSDKARESLIYWSGWSCMLLVMNLLSIYNIWCWVMLDRFAMKMIQNILTSVTSLAY